MKVEESLLPALDGFCNPELTDAWLWGRSLVEPCGWAHDTRHSSSGGSDCGLRGH